MQMYACMMRAELAMCPCPGRGCGGDGARRGCTAAFEYNMCVKQRAQRQSPDPSLMRFMNAYVRYM